MFGLEAVPDIEVKLLAAVAIAGIIGLTINAVAAKVIAYKSRKFEMQNGGLAAFEDDLGEIRTMVTALSEDHHKITDQIGISELDIRAERKEKMQ